MKKLTISLLAAAGLLFAADSVKTETLSGVIANVYPGQDLVIVKDSGGVPFDIVVTPNTRIMSGNRTLNMKDLKQDQNKDVSVKFVPERRGDVARSIQLGG
jgi:predicted transcriptional regulator